MYSGSLVALITPFKNGQLDENAFSRFVDWQIGQGTQGLVVCGSTGEGFSLSKEEHRRVIEIAVEVSNARVPVIAGASSMSTQGSVDLAQQAQTAGADGLLIVTPPYLKPTQEGIFQHFKAVSLGTNLPIIVYNHPGRTGTLIQDETMKRLAEIKNIVAVKDSTDNLERPLTLSCLMDQPLCQLSGDDGTVLAFLAQGGTGCISTIGNIVPRLCAQLHQLWQENKVKEAFLLQKRLYPLYKAMFSEASPGPIKWAAHLMGICDDEVRPPLLPVTANGKDNIAPLLSALECQYK